MFQFTFSSLREAISLISSPCVHASLSYVWAPKVRDSLWFLFLVRCDFSRNKLYCTYIISSFYIFFFFLLCVLVFSYHSFRCPFPAECPRAMTPSGSVHKSVPDSVAECWGRGGEERRGKNQSIGVELQTRKHCLIMVAIFSHPTNLKSFNWTRYIRRWMILGFSFLRGSLLPVFLPRQIRI